MQYVVFGANGYIGSYIFAQLKNDGFNVIGTSRRYYNNEGMVVYDILKDDLSKITTEISDISKTAIICIAEPNIDRCLENYHQAYKVNVIRTKELIRELSMNGFQVIYFSSDQVFDGISGDYTEESPTSPINKYGMMKAQMEQYLQDNVPEACILRISKAVSASRAKQNVFTEWEKQINVGKVYCIRGNRLSFVCIDDIYHACLLVSDKKLRGLYNIVGDKAYSRAEFVRKFYDKKGVANIDICECDVDEFSFKDKRPLNLAMSNQKFKNVTGYQFADMDYVIERYLGL